jgi:Protein of unknown function (DUF2892)
MHIYAYHDIRVKPFPMKTESYIRILAGTLVLISISLGHLVSSWWLLLATFVGINLVQSVFTGFCPAEIILRKLGLGDGACPVQSEKKP